MIGLRMVALFGAFVVAVPAVAQAHQCQVVVLHHLTDDIGNNWKPGDTLPVDIERDSNSGGSYCAHGGACVPRSINGMTAVRLSSCHVGSAIAGEDRRLVPNVSPRRRH